MMLDTRTIKEREILLESTDGKPGFMAKSLFRTEQNIATNTKPDYAKQSGVKETVQSSNFGSLPLRTLILTDP
jgi:hypothetical protein